ncbi:hypothetical protein M3Y97_00947500 [Aphelenchoides bicaudatus]|nr:hypothetical protein M3Y97_00947500 [Aphelenchoides bicaudatus]
MHYLITSMVVSKALAVSEDIQLEKELSNTGYTIGWILNTISEKNPKFLDALGINKINNISAIDISDGKGFLSRVFRVVVEFSNSTSYSFVMKIPTNDCLNDALKHMNLDDESFERFKKSLESAHNTECDAYKLIENVKDFPKVEIYYIEHRSESQPGVIVMEDLTGKAKTLGLFRSLTVQQCLNAAKNFGTLQAQMNSVDNWRGKYLNSMHTDETSQQEMPKSLQKLSEQRPSLKDAIERLLSVDYVSLTTYGLKTLPLKYNATVFCQGDAWGNNIMFKTTDDNSVSDTFAAIIDWQIISEASPFLDLARFIAICTDAEIRRECERKAVDLLYDTYCEEYAKTGKKVEYTREQAHELYDYAFINQAHGVLGMASFVSAFNMEKVPDAVYKAQIEKLFLRAELALEDAFKLIEKHNIFERFAKKQ